MKLIQKLIQKVENNALAIIGAVATAVVIAGVVAVSAPKVQAQPTPGSGNPLSFGGNAIAVPASITAGATSNGIGAIIDATGCKKLTLELLTVGATNVTYTMSTSATKFAWASNAISVTFTNAASATNAFVTNIVDPVPFYRIDAITATGTIAATNSSWKYSGSRY